MKWGQIDFVYELNVEYEMLMNLDEANELDETNELDESMNHRIGVTESASKCENWVNSEVEGPKLLNYKADQIWNL